MSSNAERRARNMAVIAAEFRAECLEYEATLDRLITALDIAEEHLRTCADRGDEGAVAALRMVIELRAIQ